jgi:hypothetical protein
VTSLEFVREFIWELSANSNDFRDGKHLVAGKYHETIGISCEKCAPLIRRELVSARSLNFVNCNTKAAFQTSRIIELTKRIALISRRSEAAGCLSQIDWDTTTSLKAQTKAVRAKRIALISTLPEIAGRLTFQAQTVSELRERIALVSRQLEVGHCLA